MDPTTTTSPETQIQTTLRRISQHPTLTPHQRRVYRVLLSIPPGKWTSYSALAAYLGSSARAVGGALRRNPFAPRVPCHRVLASDGRLGGYKGSWSETSTRRKGMDIIDECGGESQSESQKEKEKRRLLEMEGVEFDERGRAKGGCFVDFKA